MSLHLGVTPNTDRGSTVDVYETADAADRLAQEKTGPLVQQFELPMPVITQFEVHAIRHP